VQRSSAQESIDKYQEIAVRNTSCIGNRFCNVLQACCIQRCLSLRGNEEKFGNAPNGNFSGLLGLNLKYDPFLARHVTKPSNPGSVNCSYLPTSKCEDVTDLMAQTVLPKLLRK